MSKETEIMLELMKEMRDDQKELVKSSAAHRADTMKWQIQADNRMGRIEVDLRDHKEGVIQNRTSVKLNNERLNALEEPNKVKKYLYKKYMKWGGAIGLTLTILGGIAKFFGWF